MISHNHPQYYPWRRYFERFTDELVARQFPRDVIFSGNDVWPVGMVSGGWPYPDNDNGKWTWPA